MLWRGLRSSVRVPRTQPVRAYRRCLDAGDVDHRQAVVAKRAEAVVLVRAEDGHRAERVVDGLRALARRIVADGLRRDACGAQGGGVRTAAVGCDGCPVDFETCERTTADVV
eukprot:3422947-Prymnesium_polylepis.2